MEDHKPLPESYLNATTLKDRSNSTILSSLWFSIATTSSLIICGIGIVANSLIVVVIIFGSLRKSVFMTLLMFLAIADNLYLLNEVVFSTECLIYALASSLWNCRILTYFYYTVGIISSWLLVSISLERYIAVFYPLKINILCTMKRTYMTTLFLVMFASVSSLPILFTCSISFENGRPICRFIGPNAIYDTACIFVLTLLYNALPFTLICSLNALVVKEIKSRRQFRLKFLGQTGIQSNSVNETFLLPMMVSVCVFFAVMSFPAMTHMFIRMICRLLGHGKCLQGIGLTVIPFLFDYLNHSMNFFLYCLTGSVFRNKFLHLLQCK